MKYFTPERLVRLQDHSDERQFLAALDECEADQDSYWHDVEVLQRELSTMETNIGPLPSLGNLRKFIQFHSTVHLHDARVLDMNLGDCSRFRVTLHPYYDPGRLAILTYSLVQPSQFKHHVHPEMFCAGPPITWLYDELTLKDWKGKEPKALQHNILLSDGCEIELCFCDVTIERPTPLVPAVPVDPGRP
jgi:hypothetical protein